MDIVQASRKYEAWLERRIPLLREDLALKHRRMAEDAFPFLRATFYRWVQLWPDVCPRLQEAPAVLGVGDLHIENFGTWRDAEGRLIWGVNDFDEAWPQPFTNDLVRLATSALLAVRENRLAIRPAEACAAVLEGYRAALETGGRPFVLADRHPNLHAMAVERLKDPGAFWTKMQSFPEVRDKVPDKIRGALEAALPGERLPYRILHRVAGLGSLGRRRFMAVADWRGGLVAREAKELAPSASVWEKTGRKDPPILYGEILEASVRVLDPHVFQRRNWLLRRLAPDCSRIELIALPKRRDEFRILEAMGAETANVHLGTPKAAKAILKDLKTRPPRWLDRAASAMAEAVIADWKAWKKAGAKG